MKKNGKEYYEVSLKVSTNQQAMDILKNFFELLEGEEESDQLYESKKLKNQDDIVNIVEWIQLKSSYIELFVTNVKKQNKTLCILDTADGSKKEWIDLSKLNDDNINMRSKVEDGLLPPADWMWV